MLKKLSNALAAVGFVAAAASAQAGVVFTFDTGNIPGSTTDFASTIDEIQIRSLGNSSITVTDTNGNGVLDGLFQDTFTETGAVFATSFTLGGLPAGTPPSALAGYEILSSFNLSGVVGIVGSQAIIIVTAASGTITYDQAYNGVVDPGAVTIATLSIPAGSGGGFLNAGIGGTFPNGAFLLTADFNAVAGNGTGIWNWNNTNIASLSQPFITVDFNVNNLVPPPTLVFAGGPGSSQQFAANFDGSAVLSVPEPGSLALLGVTALAVGGALRRRKAV